VHGRKRATLALSSMAVATLATMVTATPTFAEPDIDDVKVKVDRLYEQAERAQERYNDAKLELAGVKKDLRGLKADEARQQTRLEAVRSQVEDSVVEQYRGQSISAVGQVVISDDPSAFLQQLTTMSEFNDMQSDMFDDYATELKALNIRKAETQEREKRASDLAAELKSKKAEVTKKYDDAKALLDDLEAEQREELEASRDGDIRLPDVDATGRAKIAVSYAMAQVGKSYVYGAAGPDSFDCSGLTMAAWAQAGVGLPHSSSGQMGYGSSVSSDDLQPGDLVFYYSPVHHVGMYIGNGMIVHAANPSSGVEVSGVFSMPYSGAVRPG